CILHCRAAPKGIALVDQIEWAFPFEERTHVLVRCQGRPFAERVIPLREGRKLTEGDSPQNRRWITLGTHGEEFDAGALRAQGADYLLYVNRATLAAEDGYAAVGTDVGDPHQPSSSA